MKLKATLSFHLLPDEVHLFDYHSVTIPLAGVKITVAYGPDALRNLLQPVDSTRKGPGWLINNSSLIVQYVH